MMKTPNPIAHAVRSRGVWGAAGRAGRIIQSYGVTEAKFAARIERYLAILSSYNIRPSLAVPGSVVARHPAFFKELGGKAELFVHGFRHIDHTKLNTGEQQAEVGKALGAFKKAGIKPKGFRAPYLRSSKQLREVLAKSFAYDSSSSILYHNALSPPPVVAFKHTTETGKSLPYRDGILELPVAQPSDIWLLRRGLDEKAVGGIWTGMLDQAVERKELFILQLHPENIERCGLSLVALLERASKIRKLWIAPLEEVAAWWLKKKKTQRWPQKFSCALAITGDIDALTIRDYALRLSGR
jgi:peptidoglycan/xylan/chitin deacetylase (PgdA/CDA1 family)